MFLARSEDQPPPAWVEYQYRKAHPVLRWLPTKLAEWAGDNLGVQLGIPPKRSNNWTAQELNAILLNNIVEQRNGTHLGTFGCIQWESDLYIGRPKARCYPFDLPGHRYRGKTRQVCVKCNNLVIFPSCCLNIGRISGGYRADVGRMSG